MPNLYLYRGHQGSGKTTAAHLNHDVDFVFEADDYFTLPNGEYVYDKDYIAFAHRHCYFLTRQALLAGYNVAVANTFVSHWQIFDYIELGKQGLADNVTIYRCTGDFKNVHNVPKEVVEKAKDCMVDIEGEIFI